MLIDFFFFLLKEIFIDLHLLEFQLDMFSNSLKQIYYNPICVYTQRAYNHVDLLTIVGG